MSENIFGMCSATEPDCILLIAQEQTYEDVVKFALGRRKTNAWQVVRVSLVDKRVVECLFRTPYIEADEHYSDVQLLSGGAQIALAYRKGNIGSLQHILLLLTLQSNWWNFSSSWSIAHQLCFDAGPYFTEPRLCASRNLLLYAAPRHSCRLVALQVTHDSKLQHFGEVNFDAPRWALCAFTSGDEHLVATAHEDCTVRLWRHVEAADAAGGTFALEECSRMSADTKFETTISTAAGLILQPVAPDRTVRLCRIDGTHLHEPLPQPQIGSLRIACGCPVGRSALVFDSQSKSLLTLDTVQQNKECDISPKLL